MKTSESTPASSDSSLYGERYYADSLGVPYEDADHWTKFFGQTADHIVREINPHTVFDVGCATGYLVEALRERGVEAFGNDSSEYAITHAREGARPYVSVGSALDPLPRRFDLITCIEVVEHLPEKEGAAAIHNFCTFSDDILLTSTPNDFTEETHVNVRPPEYWTELFAYEGYFRDVDFEAPYLATWAARYRRTTEPIPRIAAAYERVLWRLRAEAAARNLVVLRQVHEVDLGRAAVAAREVLDGHIEALRRQLSEHEALLVEMEADMRRSRADADRITSTAAGKLVLSVQDRALRVAPLGTRRRRALRTFARAGAVLLNEGPRGLMTRVERRRHPEPDAGTSEAASADEAYRQWLQRHTPTQLQLQRMVTEQLGWPLQPTVSILMPVFNPDRVWLEEALSSVVAQIYQRWELCVVDDGSTNKDVLPTLEKFAAADPRIRVTVAERNGGIVAASQQALANATGDYIALLDHDDVLRPQALHAMVAQLQPNPELELLYSDEDKLVSDDAFGDPFFKPGWSPDLLLSWNYIGHLVMMRRSLADRAGGFRDGFDGSQDHDLLLRASELTQTVGHVAGMIYSWRKVAGSAAMSVGYKPKAAEAGRRAVEEAIHRRGLAGHVTIGPHPFMYQTRYVITGTPSVAIIIPTRDRVDLLRHCIESVRGLSTYTHYTITIVDNGSRKPETFEYLRSSGCNVVRNDAPFNYSELINLGAAASDADHLLLLNNDIEVMSPDWIEALLEHSQRSEIGAVGARLLFPDGTVQHEGIVCGRGRVAGNVHLGWPVVRETSAVTGACLMTRSAVFREVDGFDESLRVAFNDVDFCFRVRRRGYRILFTPHAELRHHESASRGRLNPVDDARRFTARWGSVDEIEDPYLNPHLSWPNPVMYLD